MLDATVRALIVILTYFAFRKFSPESYIDSPISNTRVIIIH